MRKSKFVSSYVLFVFFILCSASWPVFGAKTIHTSADCAEAILRLGIGAGQRIVVVDTNALIGGRGLPRQLAGHHVVAPLVVAGELDRAKVNKAGDVAYRSRGASRSLWNGIRDGASPVAVPQEGGGTLSLVALDQSYKMPGDLDQTIPDTRIAAVGHDILQRIRTVAPDADVYFYSEDINARLIASGLGLKIFEEDANQRRLDVDRSPLDPIQITATRDQLEQIRSMRDEDVTRAVLEGFGLPKSTQLHPHQFIVFQPETPTPFDASRAVRFIFRYTTGEDGEGKFTRFSRIVNNRLFIEPKSDGQTMFLGLALDRKVELITVVGKAGSGKTLMAVAAAIAQTRFFDRTNGRFDGILFARPNVVVGPELGFLPGSIEEKLEPFTGPFRDNLAALLEILRARMNPPGDAEGGFHNRPQIPGPEDAHGRSPAGNRLSPTFDLETLLKSGMTGDQIIEALQKSGVIEVISIGHVRGRSLKGYIIIIDEAQNLTEEEVKAIVTRAGEGSMVILVGDPKQSSDLPGGTERNNGLIFVAERFRTSERAGHVLLTRVLRSGLAAEAVERLIEGIY